MFWHVAPCGMVGNNCWHIGGSLCIIFKVKQS